MPFRNFTAFEKLTAAQINQFLMQQSVATFDDATQRDAQITDPKEGQLVYNKDTDGYEFFDGTNFEPFSAGGAVFETWTPSFGLGFDPGDGTVIARFAVQGKLLYGFIHVTLGTGFSVGSGMGFTLPQAISTNLDPTDNTLTVGTGSLIDVSANGRYLALPLFLSAVNIFMRRIGSDGQMLSLSGTAPFTWAIGDQLSCQFQYEVD